MKRLATLVMTALLVASLSAMALAGEATPAPGSTPLPEGVTVPDVTLTARLSPEVAQYLGTAPDAEEIPLNAIQADVLIIQLFSIYCPYCQNDVHKVQALSDLLHKEGLDKRIKLIGIGVDNSDAEIEIYQKRFAVNFPLFPDAGGVIHKRLGGVGTPFFYVLRRQDNGTYKVAFTSLGTIGDPVTFLCRATRKAGI